MADKPFDWNALPEAPTDGAFDWNQYEEEKATPGYTESSLRGAAQGLSFGLRDEAAGALASPIGALKSIANKFGGEFTDEDLEAYRAERDASRELDRQAAAQNPASYYGGMVAGSLPALLIPGLNAVKGGQLIAAGAASGALGGLGASEEESLGGLAKDVGTGAVIGAAIPAAGKAIGKVANKIGLAEYAAPINKRSYPDLPDDELQLLLQNDLLPSRTGATWKYDPAFRQPGNLTKFGEASEKAGEVLRSKVGVGGDFPNASKISKDLYREVKDKVDDVAKQLTESSAPTATVAANELNILADEIATRFVPDAGLTMAVPIKAIVDKYLSIEPYNLKGKVIKDFAKEVVDAVSQHKITSEAAQRLNNKPTLSKIGDSLLGGIAAPSALGGIPGAAVTPVGIASAAVNVARRPIQAAVGTVDKVLSRIPYLGKFGAVIQNASQRGPGAVTATHAVLMKNPEYKQMYDDAEKAAIIENAYQDQ